MENLILSFNVVLPLFITMTLGYILKKLKMFDEDTLKNMNNVTFRTFLPTLLFYNVYNTSIQGVFNLKLMIFAVISVISLFIFLCFMIPLLEKDNKKRGVLIQGIFRSNFVIFGLPVTASLFGNENTGVSSILIAIIVPMFNMLSVVILEIFRGGKLNIRKIIKGILTNPLIIASAIGLLTLILKVKLPSVLENTISDIAKIATPLALILLGASFKFSACKAYLKQLTLAVLSKLVISPSIFITLGILLGFRDIELTALLTIFASPTAVSSFTMAQQMDSDSELAGQIVVFTSSFSVITVFIWIFILKEMTFI